MSDPANYPSSSSPPPAGRIADAPALTGRPARPYDARAVTWRSLLLGFVGVLFICGLTPYNDYVMGNTFLVGNYLPVGLVLFLSVLVIVINAPLHRFRPAWALSFGELAVILGMTLVSCALPSSGLMRYLPSSTVGFFHKATLSATDASALELAQIPDWLLPQFDHPDNVRLRANERVIREYVGRVPFAGDSFRERVAAVPWARWTTFTVGWGALLALMGGAILFGSVIVRRQWVENERLAFPLAGVYLSLIEPPQQGRFLNPVLGSWAFWLATGAVFAIHSWNALYRYFPQPFPQIPLGYSFGAIFSEPPFQFIEWNVKQANIYFSMIGIAFFLQTKVSFSLWFFTILLSVAMMLVRSTGGDLPAQARSDQSLGAALAFGAAILWIGRHHWAVVGRQMFRGTQRGEPRGRYMPYAFSGWGLVVCLAGMVVWLHLAGMTPWGAVLLTLGTMLMFLVVARVVAETGLIFVQVTQSNLSRLWLHLADVPGLGQTTAQNFFWTRLFHGYFIHDTRETLAVYSTTALRVADEAAYRDTEGPAAWRRAGPFIGALVLALVLGFFISGASTLIVHYNFDTRLDRNAATPIEAYSLDAVPGQILGDLARFDSGGFEREPHTRWQHLSLGVGLTLLLAFLRLRLVWWPLHPIGFLLVYSYPIQMIWFSVAIGWLAKALIVRFGGAPLMRSMKPVFLGLIVGEAGASAVWLVVSLMLNAAGLEYHAINLLPT